MLPQVRLLNHQLGKYRGRTHASIRGLEDLPSQLRGHIGLLLDKPDQDEAKWPSLSGGPVDIERAPKLWLAATSAFMAYCEVERTQVVSRPLVVDYVDSQKNPMPPDEDIWSLLGLLGTKSTDGAAGTKAKGPSSASGPSKVRSPTARRPARSPNPPRPVKPTSPPSSLYIKEMLIGWTSQDGTETGQKNSTPQQGTAPTVNLRRDHPMRWDELQIARIGVADHPRDSELQQTFRVVMEVSGAAKTYTCEVPDISKPSGVDRSEREVWPAFRLYPDGDHPARLLTPPSNNSVGYFCYEMDAAGTEEDLTLTIDLHSVQYFTEGLFQLASSERPASNNNWAFKPFHIELWIDDESADHPARDAARAQALTFEFRLGPAHPSPCNCGGNGRSDGAKYRYCTHGAAQFWSHLEAQPPLPPGEKYVTNHVVIYCPTCDREDSNGPEAEKKPYVVKVVGRPGPAALREMMKAQDNFLEKAEVVLAVDFGTSQASIAKLTRTNKHALQVLDVGLERIGRRDARAEFAFDTTCYIGLADQSSRGGMLLKEHFDEFRESEYFVKIDPHTVSQIDCFKLDDPKAAACYPFGESFPFADETALGGQPPRFAHVARDAPVRDRIVRTAIPRADLLREIFMDVYQYRLAQKNHLQKQPEGDPPGSKPPVLILTHPGSISGLAWRRYKAVAAALAKRIYGSQTNFELVVLPEAVAAANYVYTVRDAFALSAPADADPSSQRLRNRILVFDVGAGTFDVAVLDSGKGLPGWQGRSFVVSFGLRLGGNYLDACIKTDVVASLQDIKNALAEILAASEGNTPEPWRSLLEFGDPDEATLKSVKEAQGTWEEYPENAHFIFPLSRLSRGLPDLNQLEIAGDDFAAKLREECGDGVRIGTMQRNGEMEIFLVLAVSSMRSTRQYLNFIGSVLVPAAHWAGGGLDNINHAATFITGRAALWQPLDLAIRDALIEPDSGGKPKSFAKKSEAYGAREIFERLSALQSDREPGADDVDLLPAPYLRPEGLGLGYRDFAKTIVAAGALLPMSRRIDVPNEPAPGITQSIRLRNYGIVEAEPDKSGDVTRTIADGFGPKLGRLGHIWSLEDFRQPRTISARAGFRLYAVQAFAGFAHNASCDDGAHDHANPHYLAGPKMASCTVVDLMHRIRAPSEDDKDELDRRDRGDIPDTLARAIWWRMELTLPNSADAKSATRCTISLSDSVLTWQSQGGEESSFDLLDDTL